MTLRELFEAGDVFFENVAMAGQKSDGIVELVPIGFVIARRVVPEKALDRWFSLRSALVRGRGI